jgi:hypothetical protein
MLYRGPMKRQRVNGDALGEIGESQAYKVRYQLLMTEIGSLLNKLST